MEPQSLALVPVLIVEDDASAQRRLARLMTDVAGAGAAIEAVADLASARARLASALVWYWLRRSSVTLCAGTTPLHSAAETMRDLAYESARCSNWPGERMLSELMAPWKPET